jgi:hypothetical protein
MPAAKQHQLAGDAISSGALLMNSASIRLDPKITNKTETGRDFPDDPAPGKGLERRRRS